MFQIRGMFQWRIDLCKQAMIYTRTELEQGRDIPIQAGYGILWQVIGQGNRRLVI